MKKKILALAIAAIMVATALASVSLAYLMDTDDATNVFTVGNISIEQHEQQRDRNKTVTDTSVLWTYDETKLKDFEQDQAIVPAVYVVQNKEVVDVNGYPIKIRDESVQNYVDKIVTVENTGNTNAFVRTFIAVPYNKEASEASENAGLDQAKEWLHFNFVTASDAKNADGKTAGWYVGTATTGEYPEDASLYNSFEMEIDNKPYLVTVLTNVNILAPKEKSAPCMTGFYLDKDVCIEVNSDGTYNYYITIAGEKYNLGDISAMKIYCATQAVQADGFTDAFTALDAAFGAVSETNNPFYKPQN